MLLALTVLLLGAPQTPELSDSEVVAAIALGRATQQSFGFHAVTSASGFLQDYTLTARGPFGRVVTAAAEAARYGRPFTPDSVSAAMRAPVLVITAAPNDPIIARGAIEHITSPASHMVLRVRAHGGQKPVTIQPQRVELFRVTWGNIRVGPELRSRGITAFFDLAALPAEDFDIVVIQRGGKEHRRTVKQQDRARLR